MKSSGKNHISILTRFFFVLLTFFLTSLINPSISYAGGKYHCDNGICDESNCTTGYHGNCTPSNTQCTAPTFLTNCEEDVYVPTPNTYVCHNNVCNTLECYDGFEGKCSISGNSCTGPLSITLCTPKEGTITPGSPVITCPGGIETALGCIPYEIDNFTPSLLGFLAGIIGAIALVVMLVGTITIMTASGNPEAVKKGKELFTAAITGLLFIIFSVALLRIVAGDIIKLPGF